MVKRIDDLEENERFFKIISNQYPYVYEYIYKKNEWNLKPIYHYDDEGKLNRSKYVCHVPLNRSECVYTTLEEVREILIESYKNKAKTMMCLAEKIKNVDWDKEIE